MSNPRVEILGKERRLFYDKVTGDVQGLAGGGGALATLNGDDLIIATFNDETAPDRIGILECYYNPLGPWRAVSVNLGHVAAYHQKTDEFVKSRREKDNPSMQNAFAELLILRDLCVVYKPREKAVIE